MVLGKQKKQTKQKKQQKLYLKNRITASTVLVTVVLGFIAGSTLGNLIYADRSNDHIPFSVVYSSEKSTWMSEAAVLFADYWEDKMESDPSLKPISIDMQPYGSGDSLIALLNEEIKPTIWSPASNIWVPMLNAKWSQLTGKDDLIAPNFNRIIYSPVVIATWDNFFTDHNVSGFHDLHDLIVENPGLVKMAHTDPRASNSGFMATVMMVSSFLDKDPSTISLDDLANREIQQWMREIESAAILYGKSTGFLGRYMRDQGPESLEISILYENLVQDYTQEAEERHGQKLVAIYPEEGALFSDHPFCTLQAPWVSEEQKMVAGEFLEFLNQKELVIKAIATGFRPINSSLLLDVDVKSVYDASFNADHGVTNDPAIIIELIPPVDGHVLSRIPDLWLLTRNTV